MRETRSAAVVFRRMAPGLWGALLAACLCYSFFTYEPGQMHLTHEAYSYVYRLVEFADVLASGHPFPQWASDFRQGLGSPYFGYYQPGFFYAASAFATVLSPAAAIGAALWCFAVLGYAGVFRLVRDRFGALAGTLAGTALLLGPYPRSDLYARGDFSEYAGMLLLPFILQCLIGWLDTGRPSGWWGAAVGSGVIVMLHPAAALIGHATLGLSLIWFGVGRPRVRMAWGAAALAAGIALASIYWLPLMFEWDLVYGSLVAAGGYHYSHHFIDARSLLGLGGKNSVGLPWLDGPILWLLAASSVALIAGRRAVNGAQWRLVGFLWTLAVLSIVMMDDASKPVWDTLPLLHLLQFPWRFHVLLAVAMAALAGCVAPPRRSVLALGVVALTVYAAPMFRPHQRIIGRYPMPATARDLTSLYIAPDAVNEWLPAGAQVLRDDAVPPAPLCEAPCRIETFERGQSRFRATVSTDAPARLTLPQYWFPVGWRVTLDGVAVPIDHDARGLMVVSLGPTRNGRLDVDFAMTPMRRRGLGVSAATVAALLALLATGRPAASRGSTRTRAAAPPTSGYGMDTPAGESLSA